MPLKFLLVGLGRHGRSVWCENEIPKIHASGKAELVGVVDPSQEALDYAKGQFRLTEGQCHKSIDTALSKDNADFLIDSTRLDHRETIAIKAMEAGLDVYMEKPVGGSMESACRILNQSRGTKRKVAVNLTNRFFQDKQSFEHHLHSGDCGTVDSLYAKFGWRVDQRPRMYRQGQLLEGAVHALSYLRSMARSRARFVTTYSWNPPWSPMADGGTTLIFIEMENGIRCHLESSWATRVTLNGWGWEYVRADCEKGALELNRRKLAFWTEDRPANPVPHSRPFLESEKWGHTLLIDRFIDWVAGEREEHPTDLEYSIQCMALLFAAIKSANGGGNRIDVQKFLNESL